MIATPGSEPSAGRPKGGLRERKKQRTRESIQREAMRLFLEQGYEETTVEQIAEAAEVSPSTFFNYFPTKEDVVFTDPYDEMFVAALLERPREEPIWNSIRHTMTTILSVAMERDRDLMLARGRLILSDPGLKGRQLEELQRGQALFRQLLAERIGADPNGFELRVVTDVMVTALMTASQEWTEHSGRDDLVELVVRALDVVEAGARLDVLQARPV